VTDQSRRAQPKDPRTAAALQDYFERVDRGETVDREKYLAQYAVIADQLRSFIAAEEEIRKLAGAEYPLDRSHDSTESLARYGQETLVPQSGAKQAAETGLAGQFGRYRVIRALGKGAMGTVYLAEDTQLQRQIALKTPHFTDDPTGAQLERFYREARAAGMLRHPHICPIHDVGQIDGKHYISMAYIEGRPLSAFIHADKPQSERQILIVIRKLALALEEAHEHAIVHRDLKPANIMIDKRNEPIIMDFGLARQTSREGELRLTQTGIIVGTPAFMSPEQVEGDPAKIGSPTDQYSLGVILYELLTGRLPFQGSMMVVMAQILSKEPPRPSQLRPEIDVRVEALCLKMMAKKPSERFPSMKAVADELATILKNPSAKAAPQQKPAPAPTRSEPGDGTGADVGASLDLKALPSKTVTESDLAAIGLLKVKPALAQAPATDQDRAGSAARNRLLRQFTKPWNDGGWIAWSVLALGLAIFGVMAGVILIPLGKSTALVIEITDPDVKVEFAAKGNELEIITGLKEEKVYVEPGAQELTISYGGLRTKTKRIELNKGDKKTITVSIVNKEIVASLDHEFSLIPDSAKGHGPRGEATAKGTAKAQVKGEGPRQEPLDQPLPNVAAMPPKVFGRPFLVRGDWTIEHDEIVQPTLASGDEMFPLLTFGEPTWSNYDLTLEAKKTGGRHALGIFFHWLGPGHYREFSLVDNGEENFAYTYNGKWGRENGNRKRLPYASNRWYTLKVEVRGDTFRGYLDGELLFEQSDARFAQGRICLYTWNAAARFRRIRISDPQGKLMCEGLPVLTPSGDGTTPKTDTGQTPRLLTAEETDAINSQKDWAARVKTPVISTSALGIKLALIPPGEFLMGAPDSERRRHLNEKQHRVRLTKPFYLGVYEITQSEFERVMGHNPSYFSNSGGRTEAATGVDTSRYPVDSVTWFDAIEFCNKLSEKEGRQPYYRIADIERNSAGWIREAKVTVEGGGGYLLPTEAQWEYACRAGTTTPFNFGTADNGADCNCMGKAPYGTEEQGRSIGMNAPVGSYRPNAFGLYDMHGNVWEWCWDLYNDSYYKHSPEADPPGPVRAASTIRKNPRTKNAPEPDPTRPPDGPNRVHRGGCWSNVARDCRSASRNWRLPGFRDDGLGFRVARSVEE
jgi:serine/threonine protein kinase/formylglycine-generating enzyme required for sulfatase activity